MGRGWEEEESESFVSITPVLTTLPNRVIHEVPQTGPLVFAKTGDEMKSEDENSTQDQKKKKKKQETKLVFSTKLVFFTGVSYPVLDLPYLVLFHCWPHILH
jgi:hypothetical protein